MIFNDNIKVLWSVEFIQKFEDQWSWLNLSSNTNLPWSIELIKNFEDKWDWKSLSSNTNLPWSIELIKNFEDKWYWKSLSEKRGDFWSIELIKHFEENWDWTILSSNTSIPWSVEMIDSFLSSWDWNNLSSNHSLPLSIEMIDKFKSFWNWHYLNSNHRLPLSIELLNKYKWNWDFLSEKRGDFWSIELIKHFEDKWNWAKLGSNRNLPWSKELIKQFGNNLKFNIFYNKSINWSDEFLEKYKTLLFNLEPTPNSPLELLENYDKNWFETESVFNDKSSTEKKSWLIEDDIICEKFIKWNSDIKNEFLKLEEWLETKESKNIKKLSEKNIKNSYNKKHINVPSEKWEDIFWKKISASNNINFEFINKFQNELDWEILIKNSSLSWSLNEMSCFARNLLVEPKFWILLKPHLNSTIVNNLLQNNPKADPISNYSHYTSKCHTLFSVITFGKYRGKTLYEIIRLDSSYINWCIINLTHFYINKFTLNAIKIFYTDFELSENAIKILDEKAKKIEAESEAEFDRNNYYNDDYEKPQSYEDWLDSEFGDEAGTAYWNLE